MVDSTSGISNFSAAAALDRVPARKLGQEDFIKILVAQLTSQDPLNPQKDTEFVAQMAQFSALESAKAMQAEIQTLRANQLLGQTVEVRVSDDATLVGTVTAVDNLRGEPRIVIGESSFTLNDVVRVEQPPAKNN